MKQILGALIAGLVFGLGLAISQLINPAKVLAFLDVAGRWDPSLLVVMAGAVAVSFIGFRLAQRRSTPLFAARFELPTRRDLDTPLIGGAVLFGVGWGLTGLCPGPAIAALGFGLPQSFVFFAALVFGAWLRQITDRPAAAPGASPA